jgi:undecaprenyl-diphosphatase
MEWLEALVLGAVQGVTEFLPISSDGHLTITQQAFAWLTGSGRSGAENLFFDVMLHLGTLLAILVYYRAVVKTGAKGLLGSTDVPPTYRRAAVIRTGLLAGVATTPLIPLALFFMKWIKQAFESTTATGVGFLITAAVLLLTIRLQGRGEGGKGPAETTWLDALLIGLAQMFAPLPGVSRSGLTVAAALGLGLSRSWAVGFSLLIAVPAILGAAVKELKDVDPATLGGSRVAQTIAAAALAGLVGYGAIIWLVKIVRSGRIWYFSVYLIVLGAAVLAVSLSTSRSTSPPRGESSDARVENTTDRSRRRGDPGPLVARRAGRPIGALAGPLAARANASVRGAGALDGGGQGAPGLVLGRPLAGRP